MDWKKGFKAERKAEWSDIAQAIHDSVTMEEVIKFYIPGVNPRMHRIPCPIHHGKDYNFSYTRYGYRCFVCEASGDVIAFVKEIQGCATRVDAMRMIDRDFNLHLPINGEMKVNAEELSRLHERVEQAQKLQKAQEEWEQNYSRLMDEYVALDLIILFSTDSDAVAQAKERQGIVSYLINAMPSKPK